MIQVTGNVTADVINALAGSDLQSAPGPGVVMLWAASSTGASIITFTAPPNVACRNIRPMLRANGVPQVSDDSPVALAVNGGEQIALQIDIAAGETCGFVVKFIGKDEL